MSPAEPASEAVTAAILDSLAGDAKTADAMNALVVWTELGRALQGALTRKGADAGLLRTVTSRWCRSQSAAAPVQLDRFAYLVDAERRLSAAELAGALRRLEGACASALHEPVAGQSDDGGRAAFAVVARGWFSAGIHLVTRLGAARGATEHEVIAVLGAWCERYLPADPAAGKDLGVYVVRK